MTTAYLPAELARHGAVISPFLSNSSLEMTMANRQQNYQSGSQRYGNYRPSDEDDNQSARDSDRDYGRYAENYDEGRGQSGRRRDMNEQSGYTGRSAGFAGYGDFGQGDYDQPG